MKFTDQIKSILGGHSPTEYMSQEDQFIAGYSIDPDQALDGTGVRSGGIITPVSYSKFSGAAVSGVPNWLLTSPKDVLLYSYNSDGEILSWLNFASETTVGTATSGAGNGAAYYNNYHYFATPTNISRYGPLDGSPSLTNTVWTGSTLATQSPLTNSVYPAGTITMPNHAMHVHSDNKLYICDYVNGQGQIHFIKTRKGSAEGDTNDGSTYGALVLPFGYRPVDIESFGTDLAIIAIQTTDTGIVQGKAAMFLWDCTSVNFYREIPIPAPMVSAIVNKNGELFVFGGEFAHGFQLLRYLGGYSFEQVYMNNESIAPVAGAVDVDMSRIVWSASLTDPGKGAFVMALGSRNARLNNRAVFNVAQATGDISQAPVISAIKVVQQSSGNIPRYVLGWVQTGASTAYGLDKQSQSISQGTFISRTFTKGRRGQINELQIPLSKAVAAGTSIEVFVVTDGGNTTFIREIKNSTDPGARIISLYPNAPFQHSYTIEFLFANTTNGPSVALPVTIIGDIEG